LLGAVLELDCVGVGLAGVLLKLIVDAPGIGTATVALAPKMAVLAKVLQSDDAGTCWPLGEPGKF